MTVTQQDRWTTLVVGLLPVWTMLAVIWGLYL